MNLKDIIDAKKGKRSLKQFAKDIGVSRQTLYNAIDGQHEPSYKLLKALGLLKKSAA